MAKGERKAAATHEDQQRHCTDDVYAALSALVLDTFGVYRLTGGASVEPGKRPGARSPKRGIRVVFRDNAIQVDIRIVVYFGIPIPEIARRIQKDTKEFFDRVCPQDHVSAVNVWVDGVRSPQANMDAGL